MLKKILCYGDSNTWGYIPGSGKRFSYPKRWTGLLKSLLPQDYQIIEEGLNGRTVAWNDPSHPGRNGLVYLLPCLESHQPIDLIIILLGTNDLKNYFQGNIHGIGLNMERMIHLIQQSEAGRDNRSPQIILLSIPYVLDQAILDASFQNSHEKSVQLAEEYKKVAFKNNCHFINISALIQASPIDGVHLDDTNHKRVAEYLYTQIYHKFTPVSNQ